MAAGNQERQTSDSFLVRCWREPREVADEPDVVRVYVRNLRTGEEHYLNDTAQVGELVERGLHRQADRLVDTDGRQNFKVG